MNVMKKILITILCVFCISAFCGTAVFAAVNKAVRVKVTLPETSEKNIDDQSVFFGGTLNKKCKATKNMKLSCTVYIPVNALKKGDFFVIDPMVGLNTPSKYLGTVFGKYRVQVEMNNKGTFNIWKQTDEGVAGKLGSKYASVKKQGNFYVVTIKKIPLCSWAFNGTPDNKVKMYTAKSLYLSAYARVYRNSSKKWTGYLYMDNITLYAQKTLKMTFDKKDYKDVFAYKFNSFKSGTVKAAVKAVK